MSARQYNKYMWFIDTIHAAGRITFPDLEAKWARASANEDHTTRLPRSTFNKIREEVGQLCNVLIECDRSTNEYYIKNTSKLDEQLNTYSHYGLAQHKRFEVAHPLEVQRVVIDAIPETAEDLRRYPLHPSQKEITQRGDESCTFEYLMSPTLDFYMKIRSLGNNVELLEPAWLRDELRKDIELLYTTYVTGETSIRSNDSNDEDFIHPMYFNIMNRPENCLYLNINQNYFDEIMAGTKTQEFREVKPTTIKRLLQLDEEGYEIEDEFGNSMPIKYDYIHFRVGMNKVADEAIVEVKDAYTEIFVDEKNEPIEWQDEKGDWWTAQQVVFELGKIIDKNIVSKN